MKSRGEPERGPVAGAQSAPVRRARRLDTDRAERERLGLYLTWGLHLAQEALAANAPLEQVFVAPPAHDSAEGRAVLKQLAVLRIPTLTTTERALESIVAGSGQQGFVLLVRRPDRDLRLLLGSHPTLLLLAHGVQDPGNIGSMARTAMAFGAGGFIVLEGCADPFGSRASRSAMGALFRLPVLSGRADSVLPLLRESGLTVLAAAPGAADTPQAIDLARPVALLVGNEGRGLPGPLLSVASGQVRIPMAQGVSSLNVHAAAAVLLYETMRQRSR